MARRVVDPYPPLDGIARTLLKPRAHLAGARRFFSGEGLVSFADSKRGLSELAGETYLPPARYRQLANFLDQNATPSIVGFRCSLLELPSEPIPQLALTPMQRFVAAAQATLHDSFSDEGRDITLRAAEDSDLPGWDWQADLQYEHYYRLDGGARIPDEATLRLYARAAGEDVDVAVIVLQSADREVAAAWLHKLIARRWIAQPMVLPLADKRRKECIRTICARFGIRLTGVRSPDVYPSGSGEAPTDPFLKVLQRAPYETAVTDLDTIMARADADSGTLGGIAATLWERRDKASPPSRFASARARATCASPGRAGEPTTSPSSTCLTAGGTVRRPSTGRPTASRRTCSTCGVKSWPRSTTRPRRLRQRPDERLHSSSCYAPRRIR